MTSEVKAVYRISGCAYPALVPQFVAQNVGIYVSPAGEACTKGLTRTSPGCAAPAQYFRIWLNTDPNRRPVRYRPHSNFCEKHARQNAKQSSIPILATVEEYSSYLVKCRDHETAYREERDRQNQKANEEIMRRCAEDRRRAFEEHGRVLAASGVDGRIFEKVDGSYECELRDGSIVVPCCWYQGLHIIRTLVRGHVCVPPHTEECQAK